jgi:hypothetical protein
VDYILAVGAALNFYGGVSLILSLFVTLPLGFPRLPAAREINPPDYLLYRLFTAGTAFAFGSMYVYLFMHPRYALPFLVFGTALKYWAFAASLAAYLRSSLPRDILVTFGVSNLLVALLFSYYLIST